MRPSHEVSEYMQRAGYRIIPVNPHETEVLGEKSYAWLEDVPEDVDVVNVFRRAEEVPPVVESAIRVGAKVVWMQLGIENEEAAERARAAGLAGGGGGRPFFWHMRGGGRGEGVKEREKQERGEGGGGAPQKPPPRET